ncbi:hypothetical protein GCM10009117_23100 [Gangjinia marincola]|uniref:ACB domain-containing protein n=1 Tax=Gangjinia marincola TaxID=578463 RepID=A0ABN1MJT2_9FLAO
MKGAELNTAFKAAVEKVNHHDQPFPADFLLKLYAHYKIATKSNTYPGGSNPLINAFKANALFQLQNTTVSKAKKGYITLVENYFDISLT